MFILLKSAAFFCYLLSYLSHFCFHVLPSYRQTKWCPAPGCENAVLFDAGNGNYDVSCFCTYSFCWKVGITNHKVDLAFIILHMHLAFLLNLQCTEEAHRPVDCATVEKWILKNSAESENMNWYIFWHSRVFLRFFKHSKDFKVKLFDQLFPFLQSMLAFQGSFPRAFFFLFFFSFSHCCVLLIKLLVFSIYCCCARLKHD